MPALVRWFASITQRQFLIAMTLLVVAVSVQYALKVVDLRNGKQDRSAILRWREQLLQLDSGENIYQRFTYPNPPIMALMLRPLAELPPLAGALIWFFLKAALAVMSFAMVFRIVETPGQPFPPWAAMLAVLLSIRPILGDLTHGNVNILILFLVVSMLFAFRNGWDMTAGAILALAIACKVTPALFVGYFLWKRAWRCLLGCSIGLGAFFFVVPALFLGWDQNLDLLTSWIDQMVKPYIVGGVVTSDHPNQSLPGLLFRMLTQSPSFSTYVDDIYTPVEFCNVLALQPSTVRWIVKGCMGLFALGVVWTCRTPLKNRAGWRLGAEAAIIVLGMLLFSERTWKHHCVTLMVPFTVLSYSLATGPAESRRSAIRTLIVVQAMIASTSTALLPDDWAKLAQVSGAYVWAFVALVVELMHMLRTPPAAAKAAKALPPVSAAA